MREAITTRIVEMKSRTRHGASETVFGGVASPRTVSSLPAGRGFPGQLIKSHRLR